MFSLLPCSTWTTHPEIVGMASRTVEALTISCTDKLASNRSARREMSEPYKKKSLWSRKHPENAVTCIAMLWSQSLRTWSSYKILSRCHPAFDARSPQCYQVALNRTELGLQLLDPNDLKSNNDSRAYPPRNFPTNWILSEVLQKCSECNRCSK